MFLAKVNQDGDTIWTRSINLGSGYCYQPSVQETSDFGTILSGTMYENDKTEIYVSVVKMNSAGEIEWVKKITGPENFTYASRIKQTPDGGFTLFGSCKSGSSNYITKPFLLKLSPSGDFEWAKSFVFQNVQNGEAIDMVVVEGGLGLLTSLEDYATLIKTDFDGNFIWGRKSDAYLGIEIYSNSYPKLNITSDGGFIFTVEMGCVKLDSYGNYQWDQFIELYSLEVIEIEDGGYLVCGNGPLLVIDKLGTSNPQIGIIKTDSVGNSSECVWGGWGGNIVNIVPDIQPISINFLQTIDSIFCPAIAVIDTAIYVDPGCVAFIGGVNENPSEPLKLSIYPNPSEGIFQVGINKQDISGFASLVIFNILGEKVFKTTDLGIFGSVIDLRAQPGGVYFVRCQMGEVVLSEKIVVSHK